jgi:hypothetical protein
MLKDRQTHRQTDTQTDRLFQKGQIRYQESILRHFRAKKNFYSKIPRNGQTKLKMPTSALLIVGIKRQNIIYLHTGHS